MDNERGLFVTLDGPSGVGKTTVSALLVDKLQVRGVPALRAATPSKSALGDLARHGTFDFHGTTLTCLVAADRYHHDETIVRLAVEAGTTVVCDRYVPSSLVLDQLDGVERDFIWAIYQRISVPNLAVILSGDAQACSRRAALGGRYSRFQGTTVEHSWREASLYREALEFLRMVGYPVYEHDIGATSADAVAEAVIAVILKLKESQS